MRNFLSCCHVGCCGSSHGKINAGRVAGRNFIPWEGGISSRSWEYVLIGVHTLTL